MTSRTLSLLLIGALAASAAASGTTTLPATEAEGGPAFPHVKIGAQAVAGLSAGAFFAVQYQVAFSSELAGAGVIAGGPFYCAQGSEAVATTSCMSFPSGIDVSSTVSAAQACAKGGVCDPVSSLARHRAWLFSGTKDTVVHQGVMDKLAQFYGSFMPQAAVNTTFGVPAEHSWITDNYGSSCGTLGSPYINNCGLDAAHAMLSWVLNRPALAPPAAAANQSAFYALDQGRFTPAGGSPGSISMGPSAYAYVPAACAGGAAACTLVTVAHGCQQTLDDIGGDFIHHIGVNEVAESNNLVVLYPQVVKAYSPLNPEGCFDWWGYSSSDYANQQGPQMATVHSMTQAIVNGTA